MNEQNFQKTHFFKSKKFLINIFIFFILVLLSIGSYIAHDAYTFLNTPASSESKEIIITIAPGATFDRVAWDLKKAGAISDVYRFRLLGKYKKAIGTIKAGNYQINTNWLPSQVLEQVTKGKALLYRLSLREGLTWWETAREIEKQGFARFDHFAEVIHDPQFLQQHAIPFSNAEGFLFPETYLLGKPKVLDKYQAKAIASLLVKTFWEKSMPVWKNLPIDIRTPQEENYGEKVRNIGRNSSYKISPPTFPDDQKTTLSIKNANNNSSQEKNSSEKNSVVKIDSKGFPVANYIFSNSTVVAEKNFYANAKKIHKSPENPTEINPECLKRWVILASLVEKETSVPSERAIVAGVYANRLNIGMLLQCDPTVIYGEGQNFSGSLRYSHLRNSANKYNTYQHGGLPPGPISSMGTDSLIAALYPQKHDYLFFVANRASSGHIFSKTFKEHTKAVRAYRSKRRWTK